MSDLVDAGRLITFALDITARPGMTGDAGLYRQLIGRFRMEGPFRRIVEEILEGADCTVTDASEAVGLIVHALPTSPWAWKVKASDLPWNKQDDHGDRAARMLVIVALMARPFPTGIDLEDALDKEGFVPPPVGVQELESFIRQFCEHERDKHGAISADLTEEQHPLWSWWLTKTAVGETGVRVRQGTTSYAVYQTLDFLADAGLLRDITKTKNGDHKQYVMRRRLLLQYRDFLLDPLFNALREYTAHHSSATQEQ